MFDLERIKKAASEIGIQVKMKSNNPGIKFIMPEGNTDFISYTDLSSSLKKEFNKESRVKGYKIITNGSLKIEIDSTTKMNKKDVELTQLDVNVSGQHKISKNMKYHVGAEVQEKIFKESNSEAA